MPTITLRPVHGDAVSFSYEGGHPEDGQPGGAVLSLLIAQGEQQRERCLPWLTAASRAMVPPDSAPPAPFFGDVTVVVTDTKIVGDSADVTLTMSGPWSGGQVLPSLMVCAREQGRWCIDTMATMTRLMGAMSDMMGAAQQGLGAANAALTELTDLLAKMPPPQGQPGA